MLKTTEATWHISTIKVKWDLESYLVFRSTLFSAAKFAPVNLSWMHVYEGHKAKGDGFFSRLGGCDLWNM